MIDDSFGGGTGVKVTDVMGVLDAARGAVAPGDLSIWDGDDVCCESRTLAVPSEDMTGDPIELRE